VNEEYSSRLYREINIVPDCRAQMLQRPISIFGMGCLSNICTPSCTACCMAVFHSGKKAIKVVKKVDTVTYVHNFILFKVINVIQLEEVELFT